MVWFSTIFLITLLLPVESYIACLYLQICGYFDIVVDDRIPAEVDILVDDYIPVEVVGIVDILAGVVGILVGVVYIPVGTLVDILVGIHVCIVVVGDVQNPDCLVGIRIDFVGIRKLDLGRRQVCFGNFGTSFDDVGRAVDFGRILDMVC